METNTVKEDRIWGPPGCGKTTYLGRQIQRAAEKYGPDKVLVTSFTKAAAKELANRGLPMSNQQVGTLHAHCYRAIDRPPIAETWIKEFNKEYPQYRLTPTDNEVDDFDPEFTIHTFGDECYANLQIARAKMLPQAQWTLPVRRFVSAWETWKYAHGMVDFTDMIELVSSLYNVAPGAPSVIVVDEAQDLTKLQLSVVRQWGRHAEHLILAADDDQTIYTFAGAAPEVLLDGSGEEHFRHVLSQSYRMPRSVHALSQEWIQKLATREPKEYKARDEDGQVRLFHRGNYKDPHAIVDDAEQYVADGKTVMFLATCSYMIEPLKRSLRARGLPFQNPYRRKRIDWNPLGPSKRGVAPVERFLAYVKAHRDAAGEPWTGEDIRLWTAWLRGDVALTDGAAELIQDLARDEPVPLGTVQALFRPDVYDQLATVLGGKSLHEYGAWWVDHVKNGRRNVAAFLEKVASKRGAAALTAKPQIIIGTGHSVKGGEADVVYLFPDLSASGMRQWEGRRDQRDAVIRLGYVMMTRAREVLVICQPAGSSYMPIAECAVRVSAQTQRRS